MKTDLPKASEIHRKEIELIRNTILKHYRDRVSFIILFGSFARGNWVYDRYQERHIWYEYASDFDIFVVANDRYKKPEEYRSLQSAIGRRLEKFHENAFRQHRPHVIVEPLWLVNKALERGRYFYVDIKREGILLYENGEDELAEPRPLTEAETLEMVNDDYDDWYYDGVGFLEDSEMRMREKNDLRKAAFYLHQATESFLNCALLVMTGYKPKTHDLNELIPLCASENTEFLKLFPRIDEKPDPRYTLLQEAYIRARYDKTYRISEEQLTYLIGRVEVLKALVKEVYAHRVEVLKG